MDDQSEIFVMSSEEEAWNDEEIFGPEAGDGHFACPPPEHEAFQSLLGASRENAREQFLGYSDYVLRKDGQCEASGASRQAESGIYPASLSWLDDVDKQRESIGHAYNDFVQYRRNKESRRRMKDIEANITISEGVCDKPEEEQRRHTFGGESFRDKVLSFLDNGDLSQILLEDDIDWGDHDKSMPDPEGSKTNLLVDDLYYPGLLDDTINNKIDFNEISFKATFGDGEIPEEQPFVLPLSLLEAFDLRLNKEQGARKKTTRTVDNMAEERAMGEKAKGFMSFLKEGDRKFFINRDEVILANAVDVDLAATMRDRPENELSRAIGCLQRAEVMNDYDKSLQAAEDAYNKAPADLAESAAVYKARTFKADISSKKTVTSTKSYNPIEIISYMGITEPLPEDNIIQSKVRFA